MSHKTFYENHDIKFSKQHSGAVATVSHLTVKYYSTILDAVLILKNNNRE